MTTPIATQVNPSLWSNFLSLFGAVDVVFGTITTVVGSIDDMAVAAKAQTAIIRDTSIHDADMKRITLDARMAARTAKLAETPLTD